MKKALALIVGISCFLSYAYPEKFNIIDDKKIIAVNAGDEIHYAPLGCAALLSVWGIKNNIDLKVNDTRYTIGIGKTITHKLTALTKINITLLAIYENTAIVKIVFPES